MNKTLFPFRKIRKAVFLFSAQSSILLLVSACSVFSSGSGPSEENGVRENGEPTEAVSSAKRTDPASLLKLAPGHYDLKKNPDGKITSVLFAVEVKTNRISDLAKKKARLKAESMLADLVSDPEITITEKEEGGTKERTVVRKVSATLSGYYFQLLAIGQDAAKEKMIAVYSCTYEPPEKF